MHLFSCCARTSSRCPSRRPRPVLVAVHFGSCTLYLCASPICHAHFACPVSYALFPVSQFLFPCRMSRSVLAAGVLVRGGPRAECVRLAMIARRRGGGSRSAADRDCGRCGVAEGESMRRCAARVQFLSVAVRSGGPSASRGESVQCAAWCRACMRRKMAFGAQAARRPSWRSASAS
ncbi:hypothetical protein DFH09DRAFT_1367573, partial [Mycena vulgaris]